MTEKKLNPDKNKKLSPSNRNTGQHYYNKACVSVETAIESLHEVVDALSVGILTNAQADMLRSAKEAVGQLESVSNDSLPIRSI